MPKYTVIVNCNLGYTFKAKNPDEAEIMVKNIELPKEYVEDSFRIVKVVPRGITPIIRAVKKIREELKKENTDWGFVRKLSKEFDLTDTAYRENIFDKNKKELLRDYLLSVKYHRSSGFTIKSE